MNSSNIFSIISIKKINDNENRLMQLSVHHSKGTMQQSVDSDGDYDMAQPDYYQMKSRSIVTPSNEQKKRSGTAMASNKANKWKKPELPTRSNVKTSVFELFPPSEDEEEMKSQPLLPNLLLS
jgi:hypothetical protein